MSLATGSQDILEVGSACDAVPPYLDVAWFKVTSAFATNTLIATGSTNSTIDDSIVLRASTLAQAVARIKVGTNVVASAESNEATEPLTVGQWNMLAHEVRSAGSTGVDGYSRPIPNANMTAADDVNALEFWTTIAAISSASPAYTRIGGDLDGSNPVGDAIGGFIACVSRWDLTGFGAGDGWDSNVGSLVDTLYLDGPDGFPDPRSVNEQVGQLWEGKLRHYWRIQNGSDLADLVGSDDMTAYGTPSYVADDPPMRQYGIPTVESIDPTTLVDGASFVATGTYHEFGGTDPTSLTFGGAAQTIASATTTTTTATAAIGANLYGESYGLVLTNVNGYASDAFDATMNPPSGEAYTNITETPATAGLRITSTPDIAITPGSQVHYKNFLNATAVAQDIADVTVQADGSVTIHDDTITRPATIEVRVNNNDGEGWSAFETITLDDPAAPVNPELIGTDEIDAEYFLGDTFSITLAQQLSGGTWPWTLEAGGPWPGDFALNAGTGEITGTATPVGAYGPFTVRATGDTTDVDFTVTITVSALPVSPLNTRTRVTIARVGALMSR